MILNPVIVGGGEAESATLEFGGGPPRIRVSYISPNDENITETFQPMGPETVIVRKNSFVIFNAGIEETTGDVKKVESVGQAISGDPALSAVFVSGNGYVSLI